jgi:hypothetical protein
VIQTRIEDRLISSDESGTMMRTNIESLMMKNKKTTVLMARHKKFEAVNSIKIDFCTPPSLGLY